jgi:riboflavin synthase
MFTGIILETGTVESINKASGISRLSLSTPSIHGDAAIGDSISINGVCLTVIDISDNTLSFELSDETIHATNLGNLKKGERVNLEPSLRADGKLGGHFVTGHVDTTGKILSKRKVGETIELDIGIQSEFLQYMIDRGSVAVDGISLTIVKVMDNSFKLVIIPHTEKVTNIQDKGPGSTVNIEADILGKYIKKFLSFDKDRKTMEKLSKSGFLHD